MSYRAAIETLYSKEQKLHLRSYADQQKVLFENAYVYSDSFSNALRYLGHEAYEIVYNVEFLQKTWAREKGVVYAADKWHQDILLAQIKDLKPDIVYFQDIHSLPLSIRRQLKSIFPFIKLVVIFRGYPGGTPDFLLNELSCADILLAGSPVLLEKCTSVGLNPFLVYHSFDEFVLKRLDKDAFTERNFKHDFTFAGSSGFAQRLEHQARYWFLLNLIKQTNIELWIDEISYNSDSFIASFLWNSLIQMSRIFDLNRLDKLLLSKVVPDRIKRTIHAVIEQRSLLQKEKKSSDNGRRLPEKPLSKMFPDRCHDPVFGLEMYKIQQRSKITFNIHSDAAQGTVDNMRMFQATGVGTCLLTDTGCNMTDLFEADREVVTYTSFEECIEKVNYLLSHEDVRTQIAIAGQKRTLKDHTMLNRCQQIDKIIQKKL